jgi:hypothetical protein
MSGIIEKVYNDCSRDVVIVDFSGQLLTDEVFNNFIDLKTKEKYFSDDANQINAL